MGYLDKPSWMRPETG